MDCEGEPEPTTDINTLMVDRLKAMIDLLLRHFLLYCSGMLGWISLLSDEELTRKIVFSLLALAAISLVPTMASAEWHCMARSAGSAEFQSDFLIPPLRERRGSSIGERNIRRFGAGIELLRDTRRRMVELDIVLVSAIIVRISQC
jgi:hypothetical protein